MRFKIKINEIVDDLKSKSLIIRWFKIKIVPNAMDYRIIVHCNAGVQAFIFLILINTRFNPLTPRRTLVAPFTKISILF